jgi:hypothetical protein
MRQAPLRTSRRVPSVPAAGTRSHRQSSNAGPRSTGGCDASDRRALVPHGGLAEQAAARMPRPSGGPAVIRLDIRMSVCVAGSCRWCARSLPGVGHTGWHHRQPDVLGRARGLLPVRLPRSSRGTSASETVADGGGRVAAHHVEGHQSLALLRCLGALLRDVHSRERRPMTDGKSAHSAPASSSLALAKPRRS